MVTSARGLSRRGFLGVAAGVAASAAVSPGAALAGDGDAVSTVGSAGKDDVAGDLFAQWRAAPGSHPLVPDIVAGRLPPRRPASAAPGGGPGDRLRCPPGRHDRLRARLQRGAARRRRTGRRRGAGAAAGRTCSSSPVFMHWSNVVLRGAGPGRHGAALHPAAGRRVPAGPAVQRQQPLVVDRRADLVRRRRSGGPGRRPRTSPAPRGGCSATCSPRSAPPRAASGRCWCRTPSRLRAGDLVVLECENPPDASLLRHLAGDIPGTQPYDWPTRAPQLVTGSGGQYVQYATPQWPVRIEAVLGDRLVRLAQPLKYDLRPGWPARLRAAGPTVHDSGVERADRPQRAGPDDRAQHGTPAPTASASRPSTTAGRSDVRVENCDLGFGFTSAKSNTLDRRGRRRPGRPPQLRLPDAVARQPRRRLRDRARSPCRADRRGPPRAQPGGSLVGQRLAARAGWPRAPSTPTGRCRSRTRGPTSRWSTTAGSAVRRRPARCSAARIVALEHPASPTAARTP